jgi:hypothetical protein
MLAGSKKSFKTNQKRIRKANPSKPKKNDEIDADVVAEYTRLNSLKVEEIDLYIKRLLNLYEKEKESRNYFQLERDRLVTIREVDQNKLTKLRVELEETRTQLCSLQALQQEEISKLKHKVRYLISEHEEKLNKLKLEMEYQNKINLCDSIDEQKAYMNKLRCYVSSLHLKDVNLEENIKNITLHYENIIGNLTKEYSDTLKSIGDKNQTKLNDERLRLSTFTHNTVHEITELKNSQIQELLRINKKAYDELRSYFKELINNALVLIGNLQEKIDQDARTVSDYNRKSRVQDVELRQACERANSIQSQMATLIAKLRTHDTEKKLFDHNKFELKNLKEKYAKLDLQYEQILSEHEDLKRVHDQMVKRVQMSSLLYQEKCNNRIFVESRKVELLQTELRDCKMKAGEIECIRKSK